VSYLHRMVPNVSTSSLAHALALSAHTCVSTSATHICVAATLLLLPGAGTNDSDRPFGPVVVTR